MSKRNSKKLPSTIELFQGTRSPIALAAIFRTGAGSHADKRRSKARKQEWRRDAW